MHPHPHQSVSKFIVRKDGFLNDSSCNLFIFILFIIELEKTSRILSSVSHIIRDLIRI